MQMLMMIKRLLSSILLISVSVAPREIFTGLKYNKSSKQQSKNPCQVCCYQDKTKNFSPNNLLKFYCSQHQHHPAVASNIAKTARETTQLVSVAGEKRSLLLLTSSIFAQLGISLTHSFTYFTSASSSSFFFLLKFLAAALFDDGRQEYIYCI